jgi:hypothetical protein
MQSHQPFTKGYSYADLQADMLDVCDGDATLLADLLADVLDSQLFPFTEIPHTVATRQRTRRNRGGVWTSLPKLGAHARNRLAERKSADGTLINAPVRFKILAVRQHWGVFKRSKEWERKRAVWQVAIQTELSGMGVLTLACNPVRDTQMRWIELNPEDQSWWILRWATAQNGAQYMKLVKL